MQDNLGAAVTTLVREAFEGATTDWTWFVDNEPGKGIFGTIEGVTADWASKDQGSGRMTLAGHAGHLLFSLRLANALARGEDPDVDWDDSWKDQLVNGMQWDALRKDLRAEYETFLGNVPAVEHADQETITGTIAAVAHIAYHLGAMRQLLPG